MAYVIAEPCVGTKDTACVDVCPVDCIHPRKDEPSPSRNSILAPWNVLTAARASRFAR
jgi:NAD-dependent dihydropyrimidine dehydrogenase PreA subunit